MGLLSFLNPLERRFSYGEKRFISFLRRNKLFSSLKDREIAQFIPHFYLRSYKKNEAIFFRKDPSQAFYMIKKGSVSLNIDIEDKLEVLTKVRYSESFGDNAILHNSKRIYNAVCSSEEALIYVLPQANIFEVFEDDINIKAKVLESMLIEYDRYNTNLFKAYKASFGFFDLGQAYRPLNGEGQGLL